MAQHLLGMCRWLYCTHLPSLKQFWPVPLIPEWYFSLGGCVGPERSIFPNRRIFPPERIFHFGRVCWSWKDWNKRMVTEGSTELATGYWEGVCYLKLTWEGLMCAWNWRFNKTCAHLLYWETFMLLRLIRSHRLDNTPPKVQSQPMTKWQMTS